MATESTATIIDLICHVHEGDLKTAPAKLGEYHVNHICSLVDLTEHVTQGGTLPDGKYAIKVMVTPIK